MPGPAAELPTKTSSFTASRRLQFAPAEHLVSRGSQRAAAPLYVKPATAYTKDVGRTLKATREREARRTDLTLCEFRDKVAI